MDWISTPASRARHWDAVAAAAKKRQESVDMDWIWIDRKQRVEGIQKAGSTPASRAGHWRTVVGAAKNQWQSVSLFGAPLPLKSRVAWISMPAKVADRILVIATVPIMLLFAGLSITSQNASTPPLTPTRVQNIGREASPPRPRNVPNDVAINAGPARLSGGVGNAIGGEAPSSQVGSPPNASRKPELAKRPKDFRGRALPSGDSEEMQSLSSRSKQRRARIM